MDPTNSIWEGRTPSHGTTQAEAAVSECGACVAYFKRRWTNATNVQKKNLDRPRSEAAHRELSRFSRLPTPGLTPPQSGSIKHTNTPMILDILLLSQEVKSKLVHAIV